MTDSTANSLPRGPHLSGGDAEAVVAAVAAIGASGRPLPDGLRAAANEVASRRLAGELNRMAESLENGSTFDEVITNQQRRFPRHVTGLIQAGVQTNQLGSVLLDLIQWQRCQTELQRSLVAAFTYPAILCLLTVAILVFAEIVVVGPFLKLFDEFGMTVPYITHVLIWGHEFGLAWGIGFLSLLCCGLGLFRGFGGPARWRRFVSTIPLIGVFWKWSGIAEWTRTMAVLIDHGAALPDALRLASDAIRDRHVAEISRKLAQQVEDGSKLTEAVARFPGLPTTLLPYVRWGERTGQLAEAFRTVGDMYDGRVHMRCELLKSIVPPIVFVVLATSILLVVVGLYAPMFTLLNALS